MLATIHVEGNVRRPEDTSLVLTSSTTFYVPGQVSKVKGFIKNTLAQVSHHDPCKVSAKQGRPIYERQTKACSLGQQGHGAALTRILSSFRSCPNDQHHGLCQWDNVE
eukprot:6339371-Amphidinium_carterae.1